LRFGGENLTCLPHRFFWRSSDICTTLWYNFYDNFGVLSFDWLKIIEMEKGRERIRR